MYNSVKNHGRSVGLELTLDDFQKVSDEVPFLADLKPSGKYVMEDVHKVYILEEHIDRNILFLPYNTKLCIAWCFLAFLMPQKVNLKLVGVDCMYPLHFSVRSLNTLIG